MPPLECRDEFSKGKEKAFIIIAKTPNKGGFSFQTAGWGERTGAGETGRGGWGWGHRHLTVKPLGTARGSNYLFSS